VVARAVGEGVTVDVFAAVGERDPVVGRLQRRYPGRLPDPRPSIIKSSGGPGGPGEVCKAGIDLLLPRARRTASGRNSGGHGGCVRGSGHLLTQTQWSSACSNGATPKAKRGSIERFFGHVFRFFGLQRPPVCG